jgi:putative ABC transport system permease protein
MTSNSHSSLPAPSSSPLPAPEKTRFAGGFAIAALLVAELRSHPSRTLISLLAIALGVTMGYAVHLINQSALNEFSHAVASLMGNADLEIRGPRSGFDEALYPTLARRPEVAAASPILEIEAKLAGQKEALRVLGIDALRAAAVHPAFMPIADGAAAERGRMALFDPEAIFLSPAALSWLGKQVGDELQLQVGLDILSLRIAGSLAAAGEGQRLAIMDIGAAQWRFNRLGILSRVDLKLRSGVDAREFSGRIASFLPIGVVAVSPENAEQRTSALSRAYRVNLNVLALVALFTGSFLVFSTQALSVVRRRAQLALLRVLGVTARGLSALLLAEGCLIGLLGSALGLVLGYVTAIVVLANFGGDLGGGYFPGVAPKVQARPLSAVLFFLLGAAAAAGGSLLPALEAARARPAQALKAGDEESALTRLRSPWPGIVLMLGGAALAGVGPVAGLPLPGYAAIALLLIGGVGLTPRLAHAILGSLPSGQHPVAQLAVLQLAGAPGRASIGLSGIVTSFSLMVAMAIMVASFRDSVDQWLARLLPADLYLRAASSGETGFFSASDIQRISSTTGVGRAEFLRVDQLILNPERPAVTLIARSIDPANAAARLPLIGTPLSRPPGSPPPIWVSEAMVDLYGFALGRTVTLPFAGRKVSFLVAGVWRDYARQHGAIVVTQADYQQLTGDRLASDAALWLTPPATTNDVITRLRDSLPNGRLLEFATSGDIRAVSLRIFDRSFAITYLLEAVAIIIGLFGVATSFGAQALARSREFGVLRHIGFTRLQIGVMLLLEGALLTLIGVAMGLVLGGLVSVILIDVVNPQSFHWTMDIHVPWAMLGAVASLLILSAAATALASGRRAMSASAVQAVREDW